MITCRHHLLLGSVTLAVAVASSPALAWKNRAPWIEHAVAARDTASSINVAATGSLEVAFSPSEGSEALVVKVIDSARQELLILSYSFTSAPVTSALLRAKKRGVDIRLVADENNNTAEDRSGKARTALSALATAGADVRTIRIYSIHHDKVIVADRDTVELGSFNFTDAAARRNSENVLVNWHNPKLAAVYLKHFERNHRKSTPFHARY